MNKKVLKTLEFDKIIARLTDHADSALAKDRVRGLRPSTDKKEIISSQRQTSDAATRIIKDAKPSFSGLKDIRASLVPLEKGTTLGAGELLDICRTFEIAKALSDYDAKFDDYEDTLTGQFRALNDRVEIRTEISRCIISEEEIADEASPELKKIRKKMSGIDGRIKDELSKTIASSQNMLRDTLITMRQGRYCLQVKSQYKSAFSGMVLDQSSTGSTFFIEPMSVVKLDNEMSELQALEQSEIEKILASLSALAAPYVSDIERNIILLAELDFIFAKGSLSVQMRGAEPIFDGGYIQIKKGRHPLIDDKKVVPIDVTIGRDYSMLIITGPNTGGKTVSLKTVGLFTLMGQAGLHIPAAERSHLRLYRDVFADIGDEQSIEQSLSTFSSHMINTVSILKRAKKDTLVLFDELGAGTDPTEGAALAIAILDHLHKNGVSAMATTHYSELKIYALTKDGVENASCEFDVETLSPTYRLLVGIPGKSNAFAISEKLGLSKDIIDDAMGRIGESEKSFEDVVSGLERTKADAEKQREKALRFREDAQKYKSRLEEKNERLEQSKDRILRRAHEEAREIIERAKDVADESIKRYRKWMDSPDMIREMEKERAALRVELADNESKLSDIDLYTKKKKKPDEKSPEKLEIGDIVMVHSMGMQGVVATPPKRGKCYVQVGILRSEVDIEDLEYMRSETKKAKKEAAISHERQMKMAKAMTISTELNLIGKTVAEAMPVLDKYIDDAKIARLSQVTIIHGMGTGALRSAVHDYLKRSPHIAQYRLGEYGEGGYGVTIATLT